MPPGAPMSVFRYNDTQRFPRLSFENTPYAAPPSVRVAPPAAAASSPRKGAASLPWITRSELPLTWARPAPKWPGFHNMGNTCYLNATLQCMLHLPPFAAMLATTAPPHAGASSRHFCAHRALETLRTQMVTHQGSSSRGRSCGALSPKSVTNNLRNISSSLRFGRQECASEFFTQLVGTLLRTHVLGAGRVSNPSVRVTAAQERCTPVHQVFGGHTQSRVECMECGRVGGALEAFYSLFIDIGKSRTASLEEGFRLYTKPEYLDGKNKYACPQCKRQTRAELRTSIRQAPNVLVLSLKRFGANHRSKKNGYVRYPLTLDLSEHMIDKPKDVDAKYSLTGVVVHDGYSANCGHYFAYVKATNGTWIRKDDAHQREVGAREVLEQKAYLLFYTREHPGANAVVPKLKPRHPLAASIDLELLAVTTKMSDIHSDSTAPEPNSSSRSPSPPQPATATPSPTSSMDLGAFRKPAAAAGPSTHPPPLDLPAAYAGTPTALDEVGPPLRRLAGTQFDADLPPLAPPVEPLHPRSPVATYRARQAQPQSPSVISSMAKILVVGAGAARRVFLRMVGASEPAPRPEAPAPTPPPAAAQPPPPPADALFADHGVGTWSTAPAPARHLLPPQAPGRTLSKRRRAGDELDAAYDAGRARKARRALKPDRHAFARAVTEQQRVR